MNEEKNIKVEDGNVGNEQTHGNAAENEQVQAQNTETAETSTAQNNSQETTDGETEKTPLEKAEEEIIALKDQYLRARAEFENYRKRTLKEKADLILNGGEKTLSAILPVLDDFERALADQTDDAKAVKEGMELIFHKFVKTLESLGVKKIETENQPFDVDFHEAIAMVPGMGDDKKGMVIDCVQTGYMLNDKVLRHAKVAVGQ